jgi:hypothetical protein
MDAKRKSSPGPTDFSLEYEVWLNGFFTVQEAAAERHVHTDTFKTWARKNGIKLVQLSENRLGVRRRDALRD